MAEKDISDVDEFLDDASFMMGTSSVNVFLSSTIAKESLKNSNRRKIANKIGRLVKDLSL